MGRTATLTSKLCILYIYSTNIGTEYIEHALYSPFFFSSKCSLFHNANLFGSCIIHILYTECAEIKKKNNSGVKGLILLIHYIIIVSIGDRGSTVVKVLCYKIGRSVVRSQMVSFEFFIDIKSFRSHYGPGVDSASNGNGGKGGRCVRLTTLPPSCAVVMKSGNLNLLEPSGPLQACNGTAF